MKLFIILAAILIQGCAAQIHIVCVDASVDYKSARQGAITCQHGGVSVITGKVAISDETAQVLIGGTVDVLDPTPDF